MTVLQIGPLQASLEERLRNEYDAVVLPPSPSARESFLGSSGASVRVAVTSNGVGVPSSLMSRLPALEAVVSFGVGYDTTDIDQAVERGILVSNTPDVLTDCVADTAVGLALDVLRGFSAADRFVRRGSWVGGPFPLTHRLSGRRVGILGLGRIGQAIAVRFAAFGCPVSYHSRRPVAGVPWTYAPDPQALASAVDVLVVATPGGPSTTGLVSRPVLSALGPSGYLVNIARGSVVDQDALVALLTAGELGGAGLDVFADEPHVPAELIDLDNVVLLPHVGSGTVETRQAMEDLTMENLASFLERGTLVTPVPEVT